MTMKCIGLSLGISAVIKEHYFQEWMFSNKTTGTGHHRIFLKLCNLSCMVTLVYNFNGHRSTEKHSDTMCLCYCPTRAKISGDALAMKITCSGDDGCRCRACGPTRKLTRDVLANLRRTFGGASPMHRRIFGDASGYIRGLIGATSANR